MALATRFLERYPELAREVQGVDWPYDVWYLWTMHLCWPWTFPMAYSDREMESGVLSTIGFGKLTVPLPPPGDGGDPPDSSNQTSAECSSP